MSDSPIPPRPQTPQVLLHRLPDKPDVLPELTRKPSKYIILIMGSTAVAGKVQIAGSVASALSCPLYQGDSMHESSAKAASVGASRPITTTAAAVTTATAPSTAGEVTAAVDGGGRKVEHVQAGDGSTSSLPWANEVRYRRMWLSKLTRTGLLFPEQSRPANEAFSGFGGASSTSTSRRGSVSSEASASSNPAASSSTSSSRGGSISSAHPPPPVVNTFPTKAPTSVHHAVFTLSEQERLRRANPALMVLTHPELDQYHRLAIRTAVGEYGIGVIFVPLYGDLEEEEDEDEEDLPVLRPLDPTTMTNFPSLPGALAMGMRGSGNLDTEMKLRVNVDAGIEGKIIEIINGVRDMIYVGER
jgi:hypothetical protein